MLGDGEVRKTYEEALQKGIEEAIKILKEQNKQLR